MMAGVADPEQDAVQIRQVEDEARGEEAALRRAGAEPEQQREWIRQNNVIYGGLIAAGLVLVQPFLTAPALNWSARICVIAFSAAIPLLAGLVMVNQQESFRRRATDSVLVRVTQSIALPLGFVGVVAGFWHIMWPAGVAVLVCGVIAMGIHSAGYYRLERTAAAERQSPDSADK